MKKNIIVTGGLGFIGSNLIEYLIKKKFNVINIDKISYSSNFYNVKNFKKDKKYSFVKCDLNDSKKIYKILFKYKPIAIFNLAAESQVLRSSDNPQATYKSNIFGSLNLFDSIRKLQINPKIIHASTDKVYGISDNLPYRENHKLYSNFTYDVSKISADLIAQNYKKYLY